MVCSRTIYINRQLYILHQKRNPAYGSILYFYLSDLSDNYVCKYSWVPAAESPAVSSTNQKPSKTNYITPVRPPTAASVLQCKLMRCVTRLIRLLKITSTFMGATTIYVTYVMTYPLFQPRMSQCMMTYPLFASNYLWTVS